MTSESKFILILVAFVTCLLITAVAGVSAFAIGAFVFFGITVLFPIRRLRKERISLESLCLLSLGAYSIAIPLHNAYYNDYDAGLVTSALTLCVIGSMSMVAGNFFHYLNNRHPAVTRVNTGMRWATFHRIGWLVFITGILASILAIYFTVGWSAYINAGYAGRALLKRGAGPVELGLYHTVFGFLMILLARFSGEIAISKKNTFLFIAIFTVIFVSYVSFLGIRRPSFFLLFSLIILLNVMVTRFDKKLVLSVSIPLVLALAVFASFRQVLSDHGAITAINYVVDNISFTWLDLSRTELGAPFRVLMDVMSGWSQDSLRFGYTYLQSVPNVLPSAFGLDVMSLSEEYTIRNFSWQFIAIGGNMGFFPIAEGYVNLKWAGVVLYLLVLGYAVSAIQTVAITKRTPMTLMLYVLTPPWFVFLVRTDMASFTKVVFYSLLIPYFFAVGLNFLRRRDS